MPDSCFRRCCISFDYDISLEASFAFADIWYWPDYFRWYLFSATPWQFHFALMPLRCCCRHYYFVYWAFRHCRRWDAFATAAYYYADDAEFFHCRFIAADWCFDAPLRRYFRFLSSVITFSLLSSRRYFAAFCRCCCHADADDVASLLMPSSRLFTFRYHYLLMLPFAAFIDDYFSIEDADFRRHWWLSIISFFRAAASFSCRHVLRLCHCCYVRWPQRGLLPCFSSQFSCHAILIRYFRHCIFDYDADGSITPITIYDGALFWCRHAMMLLRCCRAMPRHMLFRAAFYHCALLLRRYAPLRHATPLLPPVTFLMISVADDCRHWCCFAIY